MVIKNSNCSEMSQYSAYIHKSRYARWLPEQNRREHWNETVNRYVGFFASRIPKEDRVATVKEIEDAVFNLEVMPSMRAMMTAGPALEHDNVAGYNCFRGTETFLTREGIKTFFETVGTKQTVLSKDGEWVDAEIKCFGTQVLHEITFKPSCNEYGRSKTNLRIRIAATPDHRWMTANRGEVTNIKIGDLIPFVGAPKPPFNAEAWIMGFGFGDGTIDSRGRAKVRLCGKKDMQWVSIFSDYGHSSICYPIIRGGCCCYLSSRPYGAMEGIAYW